MKFDSSQLKNIYKFNDKGKLAHISDNEFKIFLSGKTIFHCQGIQSIKKKIFLVNEDAESHLLYLIYIDPKNKSAYFNSFRNLSVYDNLLNECNSLYKYIITPPECCKQTVWNYIQASNYIEHRDIPVVADTSYRVLWTEVDCSFPHQFAKLKGLLLGRNNNYEITIPLNRFQSADFFSEQEIHEIEFEKEQSRKLEEYKKAVQRRLDSIQDTKYHAFVLTCDIPSEELDEGDTIFMYSYNQDWALGSIKTIPINRYGCLSPISIPGGSHMYFSEYQSYISRREHDGEGMDLRKEISRQRDSISSRFLLNELDQVLNKIETLIREREKKQLFLTEKKIVYGDYSEIGLRLTFYNCFKKTIKYVNFETKSYNIFGDLQGDYFGKKVSGGKCIGPIEPRDEASFMFEDLYYDKNDIIEHICVTKVVFTFIDNSTLTFSDINNHITKDVYNKNK
ncbi:MAG: hypothetical protein IJQ94_03825 [Bacteroidales bacterium]|nr:hypothetical protein [Bacteroidales bacterium]